MWHSFDADDVAIGGGAAIIASGARRLLLHPIAPQQARVLEAACSAGGFEQDKLDPALREQLIAQGLACAGAERPQHPKRWRMRLPARTAILLATPLRPFTLWPGLMGISCAVVLLLALGVARTSDVVSPVQWLSRFRAQDMIVAALVYLLTAVVHELGHSAACLSRTGLTGGIRLTTYRGMPALAADVSAIHLTTTRGRANVALAGGVLQAGVSALLLMSPDTGVRMGATIALMSAVFVLLPLPATDGYWLMSDLLGRPLRPRWRLSKGSVVDVVDVVDVVYGWAVIGMTALLGTMLVRQLMSVATAISPSIGATPVHAAVLSLLTIYLGFVSVVFVFRNLRLFTYP